MRFTIRFFNDVGNIDQSYFQGDEDIWFEVSVGGWTDLIKAMKKLLPDYEGETYCIWDNDEVVTGGAFDPNDIDDVRKIYENFKTGDVISGNDGERYMFLGYEGDNGGIVMNSEGDVSTITIIGFKKNGRIGLSRITDQIK